MAFAVMDVLRFELGLRVPQDVSVVGFDDVPPAAWPADDLTTAGQTVEQMVAETVQMQMQMQMQMTQITEGTGISKRVVQDAALIIRSATNKQGASH